MFNNMLELRVKLCIQGNMLFLQKNERISDLINRSGGFKNMAYLKGATLIRLTEFAEIKSDLTKKSQKFK